MPIKNKDLAITEEFIRGTKTKSRPEGKIFPVRLPATIHGRLKKKAARQELSLQKFILQILEQAALNQD